MNIPITFEFKGKVYEGVLSNVSGGGSTSSFHLMIDRYYYGQLFYTHAGWVFTSNKDHFKGMDEYFGGYAGAWLDSLSIEP